MHINLWKSYSSDLVLHFSTAEALTWCKIKKSLEIKVADPQISR